MEVGPLIVIALRLIIPFSIFRWPLWGTLASLIADLLDVVLLQALNLGWFKNYDLMDKALDTYYLFFAFFVSLKWTELLAKRTSIILFGWRIIGFAAFEFSNARWLLMVFPNLFENWFLFWAARNRFFPKWQLTTKRLIITLLALLIPKLLQEWALHVEQLQPWEKIKRLMGWWQ